MTGKTNANCAIKSLGDYELLMFNVNRFHNTTDTSWTSDGIKLIDTYTITDDSECMINNTGLWANKYTVTITLNGVNKNVNEAFEVKTGDTLIITAICEATTRIGVGYNGFIWHGANVWSLLIKKGSYTRTYTQQAYDA